MAGWRRQARLTAPPVAPALRSSGRNTHSAHMARGSNPQRRRRTDRLRTGRHRTGRRHGTLGRDSTRARRTQRRRRPDPLLRARIRPRAQPSQGGRARLCDARQPRSRHDNGQHPRLPSNSPGIFSTPWAKRATWRTARDSWHISSMHVWPHWGLWGAASALCMACVLPLWTSKKASAPALDTLRVDAGSATVSAPPAEAAPAAEVGPAPEVAPAPP